VLFRGDFEEWIPVVWDASDPKPGQTFIFKTTHPIHGEAAVCVYAHDNVTPGYNTTNPQWSDWFGLSVSVGMAVTDAVTAIPDCPNVIFLPEWAS